MPQVIEQSLFLFISLKRDMGGAFALKAPLDPDFRIVAIASYPVHGMAAFFCTKS